MLLNRKGMRRASKYINHLVQREQEVADLARQPGDTTGWFSLATAGEHTKLRISQGQDSFILTSFCAA